MQRRSLLTAALGGPLMAASVVERKRGSHVKIGLNAYSFNKDLMAGTMKISDVLDFCAENNIDGVDLTGYYFPGYPKAPADEFVFGVKRYAWMNGVTIGGTGVRNDFALPSAAERDEQIRLVKDWVDVCAKLGGTMVRVFSGKAVAKGYTFDQTLEWMVPAFQDCAKYAAARGVLLGMQHHDDFLKTAAETIRLVEAVKSDWFTVILDVGSLRQGDPYAEIEKLLPHASNWQVKEQVWYGTKKVDIDLARLRKIVDKVGYRGFMPIEALGAGDSRQIVKGFLGRVRAAFA
ncbi:MAG: sugar phosphate isomerase/epimerase [Acidobacteria bacterium]|nr:sugar phosphate isomerase/epimerase [Acidobacteriota bacterium]